MAACATAWPVLRGAQSTGFAPARPLRASLEKGAH